MSRPDVDTVITDAITDKVELRVASSPIVSDCIYLQIEGDVKHVYLNKASAKVLFARLGAFLHDWSIPDGE